jgi:mRNA interferase MazF
VKRGAIVVVAAKGAYTGKPRPALVVQSDLFNPTHQSVTICPITSDCVDAPLFRIPLPPGERTGLRVISQIMVDKIVSVPRSAITAELEAAEDALRRWLGLD